MKCLKTGATLIRIFTVTDTVYLKYEEIVGLRYCFCVVKNFQNLNLYGSISNLEFNTFAVLLEYQF